MVHGGPWAGARSGLIGELAWRRHMTQKLATRAATTRGGHGELHRWNRGQRGGLMRPGDIETKCSGPSLVRRQTEHGGEEKRRV
jgi:hypothetical protein